LNKTAIVRAGDDPVLRPPFIARSKVKTATPAVAAYAGDRPQRRFRLRPLHRVVKGGVLFHPSVKRRTPGPDPAGGMIQSDIIPL
jgi:hypothetical protein